MAHGEVIEYAEDLSRLACSCAGCDGVAIRQRCHPYSGVYVEFERTTATLVLFCRDCIEPVCKQIAVARDPHVGN